MILRCVERFSILLVVLAVACETRRGPDARPPVPADTARPPVRVAAPVVGPTAPHSPARAGAVDTFDLASIGGRPVPLPVPADESACAPRRVMLERYVFRPDSTYDLLSVTKTGCGTETAAPDTSRRVGRYSISRDTLVAYVGDGSEEFQEFVARFWVDSLKETRSEGAWVYRRR